MYIWGDYVTIDGFTVKDHKLTGSSHAEGAGIYVGGTNALLRNLVVENNIAQGECWDASQIEQCREARGGGVYFIGSGGVVENCLFTGNQTRCEGPDCYLMYIMGPAIYAESSIQGKFITVTDNDSDIGQASTAAVDIGGTMINSIIYGNRITDYYGGTTTYCDIGSGHTYSGETGNISVAPEFAVGPLGDYYLSRIIAGQNVDSPCADSGSDSFGNLGMDVYTTRTDGVNDLGTADMGYHYPAKDCSGGPFADFTSDAPVLEGNPVYFTDLTTGGTSPLDYDWDFGDGAGTSTLTDPSYTYTAPGSYEVRLSVTDAGGCMGVAVDSIYIESLDICSDGPFADFDSNSPVNLGNPAVFTDTTDGGTTPYSYFWDFGDGLGSSTAVDPVYTYTAMGTYTVALNVQDGDSCSDTALKPLSVIEAGTPYLKYVEHEIKDDSGNSNGLFDPGETAYLFLDLENAGNGKASGVSATLSTSAPGITVTPGTETALFSDIPAGARRTSLSPTYEVSVDSSTAYGTIIDFTLNISSNEGSRVDTFQIRLNFGLTLKLTDTVLLDWGYPKSLTKIGADDMGNVDISNVVSDDSGPGAYYYMLGAGWSDFGQTYDGDWSYTECHEYSLPFSMWDMRCEKTGGCHLLWESYGNCYGAGLYREGTIGLNSNGQIYSAELPDSGEDYAVWEDPGGLWFRNFSVGEVFIDSGDYIDISSSGLKVYIAYVHGGSVYFIRSDDGGSTFTAPKVVNNGGSPTGRVQILDDGNGNVYVAWIDGDIFFNASRDEGGTGGFPM